MWFFETGAKPVGMGGGNDQYSPKPTHPKLLQPAVDMLSTLVLITLRLTCNPVFHLYHETNKQKNSIGQEEFLWC